MEMGESFCAPGAEEKPLSTAEPLSLDDLKLLADLFYLPYEHGQTARTMLQELAWLKNHSAEEVGPPALSELLQRRWVHLLSELLQQQLHASSFLLFPDGRVELQSSAL